MIKLIHNTWNIVKYPGDMAIYAVCTKCGFRHNVSKDGRGEDGSWMPPTEPDPRKMYRYCPMCGARKKFFEPKVEVQGRERVS